MPPVLWQTDLRFEAENLGRTGRNFGGCSSVVIPAVCPGLVSEEVVVESFEAGQPLHVFLRTHSTLNAQVSHRRGSPDQPEQG